MATVRTVMSIPKLIAFFYSMEMLGPKRKTITHEEAKTRTTLLQKFLASEENQNKIKELKPHKRVSWIRSQFLEETQIDIPVSSIYKMLRDKEICPVVPLLFTEKHSDDEKAEEVPVDL